MVQVHLGPPLHRGGRGRDGGQGGPSGDVAQLGERLPCTQQVTGSIPVVSTKLQAVRLVRGAREGIMHEPDGSRGLHLDNCIADSNASY